MNLSEKLRITINEILRTQYAQMFTKNPLADLSFVEEVQDRLLKNVRITWFLKKYREGLIRLEIEVRKMKDQVSRGVLEDKDVEEKIADFHETQRHRLVQFASFYSYNIQKINDFQLGDSWYETVIQAFIDIYREWKNNLAPNEIRLSDEEKDHVVSDFLKLDNGWKWVLKETDTCELESKAMGHCGDTGNENFYFLSLREPSKRHGVSIPHVTAAIENGTGLLHQLKGRKNVPPVPKYYPMIMPLLLDPRIKGFDDDMDPIDNFSILDLSPEDQKALGDKYFNFLTIEQFRELAYKNKFNGKFDIRSDTYWFKDGIIGRDDGPSVITRIYSPQGKLKRITYTWQTDIFLSRPVEEGPSEITISSGIVTSLDYKDSDHFGVEEYDALRKEFERKEPLANDPRYAYDYMRDKWEK